MHSSHGERMRLFVQTGLYLVTSESVSCGRSSLDILRAALDHGLRLVQLREKEKPLREFLAMAEAARELTEKYDALLVINDRLDVALAVDADGVHLGQENLPVQCARSLAPELVIGASSHSVREAVDAEREGASYVNIGPLFPTRTKTGFKDTLGWEGLARISPCVSVPFTVMGGIKPGHIPRLIAAGVRTVAVVSAVTAAPDPGASVSALLRALGKGAGVT